MNGQDRRSGRRRAYDIFFKTVVYLSAFLTVALLVVLIGYIFVRGLPHITGQLLSTAPSVLKDTIGILEAIVEGRAQFKPWGPFSDIEIFEWEGFVPDMNDETYLSQLKARMRDRLNFVESRKEFKGGYDALPEDAMDRWARIAAVRSAVNGALEQARADKTIGKSLEAEVDVTVPAEDAFLAELNADTLADLLIVSQVRVETGDSLSVTVRPASGTKCQRCWKVLTSVGTVAGHDTLCPRCAAVVKALPVVE